MLKPLSSQLGVQSGGHNLSVNCHGLTIDTSKVHMQLDEECQLAYGGCPVGQGVLDPLVLEWLSWRQTSHWLLPIFLQGMYIMFHYLKGTPYPTGDQGDARRLTNWEQIDNGQQYTPTRVFLTAVPIVL